MKKTPIDFTDQEARKLHKTNPEWREILERKLGKDFFSQDITERINSWEDMMSETGRPNIPNFSDVPEDMRTFFQAVYQNIVMVEAYNEGEKMDIYNKNKNRHYPYFATNGSPSGFAFGVSAYYYTVANAGSGSRLSFKSGKLSDCAGKKHIDIFRKMLES